MTGKKTTFKLRDDEQPSSLVMSETILAVSTRCNSSNKLKIVHIFQLGRRKRTYKWVIHFAESSALTMAVGLSTIAILQEKLSDSDMIDKGRITSWNLAEEKAQEFTVTTNAKCRSAKSESYERPERILVDPQGTSIIYLKAAHPVSRLDRLVSSECVSFERFSLDGTLLAQGETFGSPDIPYQALQNVVFSSGTADAIVPWNHRPFPNLNEDIEHEKFSVVQRVTRLVYDSDHDTLTFEELANFRDIKAKFPIFIINGSAYGRREYPAYLMALKYDFYDQREQAERLAEFDYLVPPGVDEDGVVDDEPIDPATYYLVGDSKVIICARLDAYTIYSFDPYVKMECEDPEYRRARVAARRERMRPTKRARTHEGNGGEKPLLKTV